MSNPTERFNEKYVVWKLIQINLCSTVAYAKNCHGDGFIQWHVVVIFIWCTLFVTSQFEVIFIFSNQHLGEVCCHNMHILLHALPFF